MSVKRAALAAAIFGTGLTVAACGASSGASPRSTASVASPSGSSGGNTSTTLSSEPHTQAYRDGWDWGVAWSSNDSITWAGSVELTCGEELDVLPLTYPADNATDSAQWDGGCQDGLNGNPNIP